MFEAVAQQSWFTPPLSVPAHISPCNHCISGVGNAKVISWKNKQLKSVAHQARFEMQKQRMTSDYLAHLLAQANRKLNMQLHGKGVPLEQWRVLSVLFETQGMTMRELADAVSMNRPTMTKIVDRLVSEALAYRVPDPTDRRKVRIFLSDQGKALYRQQNELVSNHQDGVENEFGLEQTERLKSMLETFLARVK
ncbi:MAG: MarR family winged helix-turn-helix transcriptional regulator [Arenibacterium sp.]